jgi:large subunit ribosomal protein L6
MVQELTIKKEDSSIIVERPSDNRQHKSLHGLTRSLIDSMVEGVTQGYTKKLEIVGVGYKAEKKGSKLVLNLGYSHPVEMDDPEGIETSVEKNIITVTGIDKQKVGNYAAVIRDWRKPEPYKGKGIKYQGEHIRRKAGKTAG